MLSLFEEKQSVKEITSFKKPKMCFMKKQKILENFGKKDHEKELLRKIIKIKHKQINLKK